MKAFGLALMIAGAIIAYFAQYIDRLFYKEEIGADAVGVLSPRALALKLIGFAAVVTGSIVFFYY